MKSRYSILRTAVACAGIGWLCLSAGTICQGQSAPNPSPDLQEVVKLSQARMPDDVIKNYITSTGKSFRLNADDIIYLNSQGVSAGVINALQTAGGGNANPPTMPIPTPTTPAPPVTSPGAPVPQPATPPPPAYDTAPPPPDGGAAPADVQPTPPPPPEVNFQYFHDQLSPWGTWVEVPGVGACWQPSAAVTGISPDWRPYYDNGQWVQTDNGLYWQSEYQWGDIPFHYGRWILQPGYGWVWVPDYTWGPAWVFWRQDDVDGCIGWAPLPYGAVFINGGFWWHGVAVGVDFDFGLGMACFTFCPYGHFHEPFFRMRGHEWAYHIGQDRMRAFYGHSVIRNEFRRDEHGRFVNNGIGRDRIEHLTRVEHANFEERNPVGDRNKLAAARTEQSRGRDTAGTDRLSRDTTRTTMESGASHGPNGTEHTTQSAKASMVYRPPSTSNAGAGRTATPNTGGGHTPAAGGGSPNQHH